MGLLIAVIVLLLLLILVAYFFYRKVSFRPPVKDLLQEETLLASELFSYASVLKPALDWYRSRKWEILSLPAADGTPLKALWLAGKRDKPCLILQHGYGDLPQNMSVVARWASGKGWSLLLPYARAHGESGGEACSLGLMEAEDCRNWVHAAEERAGEAGKLILYARDMGAYAALRTLDEPSQHLAAVISDSAYTSPKEILRHVMKNQMRMRVFPMLQLVCLFLRLRWKRSPAIGALTDAAAGEPTVPILFIHGKRDRSIPPAMTETLHKAYSGPKSLYLAEEAGHNAAPLADSAAFFRKLEEFLSPVLK